MTNVLSGIYDGIDKVIAIATSRFGSTSDASKRQCYLTIAVNFEGIRQSLKDGRMPEPGSGSGLGAQRALSEWGLDDDEEIFNAITTVERLYRYGS